MRSDSVIPHPLHAVYRAYRDELPAAAVFVDGIREVVVESREETPQGVRMHNVWFSDGHIPDFAQRFVSPEHLSWDDYATWFDADMRCEWNIKPRAFPDSMRCIGTTRFSPDIGGTRVILAGELEVDLSNVKGVPDVMARAVAPQMERFLAALVRPNLEKSNLAIAQFLDARKAGHPPG